MPTPLATPARNGSRKGSSALVCVSVIPTVVTSVLPVIRPSPGKCLTVATTVPDCSAVTSSGTAAATTAGSVPSSRRYLPIGALVSTIDGGTVSATGARLTLTPAARSSLARVAPSSLSWVGDIFPWLSAEGSTLKPLPLSCWTAPPS